MVLNNTFYPDLIIMQLVTLFSLFYAIIISLFSTKNIIFFTQISLLNSAFQWLV